MNNEEIKILEARVKKRLGIMLLITGIVGFIGILSAAVYMNRDTPVINEVSEYPELDATIKENDRYETQHIGLLNHFWPYEIVGPDIDYLERQDILDKGNLTMWPEFREDDVIWIAGHYPGTMNYIAENILIGSHIQVTTPSMYQDRYPTDSPDVLRFEIVEKLVTDKEAQKEFNTLGVLAGDVYNYGLGESWLVLQHSGEGDDIVLYLGRFISKEKGEYISNTTPEEV